MQKKNLQQNKKCKSQLKSCPLVYKKIISPSTTDERPQQQVTHHRQNMSTIPTIVNGVITKTHVFGSGPPTSLINPAYKVILSGDSHIKGLAIELRAMLTSDYELVSVVKPGSGTNVLRESFTEIVEHLTNDDILVISSGTNDYDCDNFKSTFSNLKEYLSSVTHANILVLGIPYRYDLHNSKAINTEIPKINRKLSKMIRILPNKFY